MDAFGTTLPVFLGLTVMLFGGAAWMTGQALGDSWRPAWQILPYGALLAVGSRFFDWALFQGEIASPSGYGLAGAVLVLLAFAAYRVSRARRMVLQYPWLYERAGPFALRERKDG